MKFNDLEQNGFGLSPRRSKRRRKAPVTIVVSIICTDGIVVVCDSRTTDPSGIVRDDAWKLNVISFADGNSGIIGVAGNDDLSSKTVEIIAAFAKHRKLDDYRALATCAEDAVKEIKGQLRGQYKGTGEELQRHFKHHAFELLIAYYFEGVPYTFTLDFALGSATLKKRLYVSIGCGWQLADFLISPLEVESFAISHGMWTGIYAVEQIKKFDGRCGGPTQGSVVRWKGSKSVASLTNQAAMKDAEEEMSIVAAEAKYRWVEMAHKSMQRALARIRQKTRE